MNIAFLPIDITKYKKTSYLGKENLFIGGVVINSCGEGIPDDFIDYVSEYCENLDYIIEPVEGESSPQELISRLGLFLGAKEGDTIFQLNFVLNLEGMSLKELQEEFKTLVEGEFKEYVDGRKWRILTIVMGVLPLPKEYLNLAVEGSFSVVLMGVPSQVVFIALKDVFGKTCEESATLLRNSMNGEINVEYCLTLEKIPKFQEAMKVLGVDYKIYIG